MSNWDRNNKATSLVPRKIIEVEGGYFDGGHFYILPDGGKLYSSIKMLLLYF